MDTKSEKQPTLHHTIEAKEIADKTGLAFPHTVHCLGSGELMASAMGDTQGNGQGGFILIDENFKVKGRWESKPTRFGYDFWYQPRQNAMVSSGMLCHDIVLTL